ncbi:ATP-grasp domain-containing protein [Solirubrobacter phytolaccae]|uniref:biotin carboxylase n=1 Tax=Solirubrobacter phytolaccae TaxID=1404360 RepID=A0A9X3SAG3_9ACTN|nr:carboxyl transferase domain-containing protein [Solirubrobacter phytolaccae]MDA0183633.1 ATP-grasp domain-containing protein [Solirubrobacter phytolaccae]
MPSVTQRTFRRLAIVNRGEPAMRLIHAVRELNAEREDDPIKVIALYTEPERSAMFVRHADEAYSLGPTATVDESGKRTGAYLNYEGIKRTLLEAKADAVWPGWGFVSEHPAFVDMIEEMGLVFVGPSADVMRQLGDKIQSKLMAEKAGVPVAPWSNGAVETIEEAREHAERIGFPLMIKAAAGGGGRGIRRVLSWEDLEPALNTSRREAADAFGDGTVFMEAMVGNAHHIEVQLIADGQGEAWAAGVRDCSCQRRHQKVIEESSSTVLTPEQEEEVKEASRRLALQSGYRNAGTVEFLYEPEGKRFSFMEVNARLQVEHPVTEAVTGLDLVKLQLHVASGGRLEGTPPEPVGHAIEARLNAEDPAMGFAPTPGRVQVLDLASGPGVRVDRGIATGDVIPPDFDSMVAKVIAYGRTRPEAIARLKRALRESTAMIEDGTTNRAFLLSILDRPEFEAGKVDIAWLDRMGVTGEMETEGRADAALLMAAIELADKETATERASFYAYARRGRPEATAQVSRAVEVRHRGQAYRIIVSQLAPGRYRTEIDGVAVEAAVERLSSHERRITLAGVTHRVQVSKQGADLLVEVHGVPHRITRDDGGFVRSHGPSVVVAIPVSEGDEVAEGDVVAVVESMKMETSLTAPFAGRVRRVLSGTNVQVPAHTPLLQLEAIEVEAAETSTERVSFDELGSDADSAPEAALERLKYALLGYDVSGDEVRRALAVVRTCDTDILAGEHELLDVYTDVRALSRARHDDPERELLHSPQEYLHAFLRSLDAKAERLPERFVSLLGRALAHYDVEGLDRTPALEDACYRLFVSQERADLARAAVMAILEKRLERAEELVPRTNGEFRGVLDRLEIATERRDPAIADHARQLRNRYYDQPVILERQARAYEELECHLSALLEDPDREDRDEHIKAVVEAPQLLAPKLIGRMQDTGAREHPVLLEIMTRRWYRMYDLAPFWNGVTRDGTAYITTSYVKDGTKRHLAAAFVDTQDLDDVAGAIARRAAEYPTDETVYLDLYAAATAGEELAGRLRAALERADIAPLVQRVVLDVPAPERGNSAANSITLRRSVGGGWEVDRDLQFVHPEMAVRLNLWRMSEFELERIPSPADVYLFRGVGRTNPKDERLFALAEVRELSIVRDQQGRVVSLPELEHMLAEALGALRRVQSRLAPRERLLWNRVRLNVWPEVDLAPEEAGALVDRYARETEGLGIETVIIRGRMRDMRGGELKERELRLFAPAGRGVIVEVDEPAKAPLQPLDEGARRIVQARRRGTVHPAELTKVLAPERTDHARGIPRGEFVELDFDADGALVPADRPAAMNEAGIVVGLAKSFTGRHPEGMQRVVLLGDPTKSLGSVAEPECRRIIAALDLADELGVPVEWFALSSGARISMDSGTENMDWVAAALRRIIEFTQNGGEVNVIVTGINVGAQPYWNAEATMLMHTRGILIMTPESAMVLTGKQALDFAGGVSAEDNFGIGGYDRIMGPNGQAQYWAPDLAGACGVLLRYYEHAYIAPGERFPRRAETRDAIERDVRASSHNAPGSELATVGQIFSDETNPGRKQAFDIRSVMRAVTDSDHKPLERWERMRDAEAAVVWDAHLGGWPTTVIGIESHPIDRFGPVPADGPAQWTSGTLFPKSSKKVARAINANGGRRPLVVLANLAGFDGSPESMRQWQLEYGAEIGRAIVNFRGPIVFCVISRYHGGAFVVFSQRLNDGFETIAVEGAHASVIGGSAAAGVVFTRDVNAATRSDARVVALEERIEDCSDPVETRRLRAELASTLETVRSEKMGELAAKFDSIHSIQRAVEVGSVNSIVAAADLRPYLIDAIERGMARVSEPLVAGVPQ